MSDNWSLRDLIHWLFDMENKKAGKMIYTRKMEGDLYNELVKEEGAFKSMLDFLVARARPIDKCAKLNLKAKEAAKKQEQLTLTIPQPIAYPLLKTPKRVIISQKLKTTLNLIKYHRMNSMDRNKELEVALADKQFFQSVLRYQISCLEEVLALLENTFISIDIETLKEAEMVALQDFQNMLKGPEFETRNIDEYLNNYVDQEKFMIWINETNSREGNFIPMIPPNEGHKDFLQVGKEKLVQLCKTHVDLVKSNEERTKKHAESDDESSLPVYLQYLKNFKRLEGKIKFINKRQLPIAPSTIELPEVDRDNVSQMSSHIVSILRNGETPILTAISAKKSAERSVDKFVQTADQFSTSIPKIH